ncbi:MAG: hypothetical protein HGA76_05930 [Candidatus Firestonebacteria bacterium]|nr:hypothetical protein [Candidatus Firestonebacteria bacterium]
MIWTVAVLFVTLWAAALVFAHPAGILVHLLLVFGMGMVITKTLLARKKSRRLLPVSRRKANSSKVFMLSLKIHG